MPKIESEIEKEFKEEKKVWRLVNERTRTVWHEQFLTLEDAVKKRNKCKDKENIVIDTIYF